MINPITSIQLNQHYRLQWEPAQQCHVLLFPEGMVQLNGPAAEVLNRCQQPILLADLITSLQTAFPEADDIAKDVEEFLQVANTKGWVVIG